MEFGRVTGLLIGLAVLAACQSQEEQPPATVAVEQSQPIPLLPDDLHRPNVVMQADPEPPFTYWAPPGSTIRNHPTSSGIWFAEVQVEQRPTYFGEDCGAYRWQDLIGEPIAPLRVAFAGARISGPGQPITADLRFERLNILTDKQGRVLVIRCG